MYIDIDELDIFYFTERPTNIKVTSEVHQLVCDITSLMNMYLIKPMPDEPIELTLDNYSEYIDIDSIYPPEQTDEYTIDTLKEENEKLKRELEIIKQHLGIN